MQLILASQSKYRQNLLQDAGIDFVAQSPDVDESILKNKISEPTQLTQQLSLLKAESIASSDVVIGSDQVGWAEGRRLDKPLSVEKCFQQLKSIAGKTHQLITSVCVLKDGQAHFHTDITELKMRPLTDAQILNYIELDQPLDCAGGYKLEKAGVCLFESIKSEDHSAIIGLPMVGLTTILLKLGYNFSFYKGD